MRQVILASTSVYRKELFQRLKIPFQTIAPQVEENLLTGETPANCASRLAMLKATAISERYPAAVVIGSDQTANFNGSCLGKPHNFAAALKQLTRLSAQQLTFHTAVAVCCAEQQLALSASEHILVKFRTLSTTEIKHYLLTEQPFDCVGSAKCEALGIVLMEKITSDDPSALIGLPLIKTASLLRQAGISWLDYL